MLTLNEGTHEYTRNDYAVDVLRITCIAIETDHAGDRGGFKHSV